MTAAHVLNETVLPWFEEQGVPMLRVLTDRGTEYWGHVESHAYPLFLAVENIDPSRTKARSPQTNGVCERFHKPIKNEFADIAFRKCVYHSLEQLQQDVDEWLSHYHRYRPHSGRYCWGQTPMQTWQANQAMAQEKQLDGRHPVGQNHKESPSFW